MNNPPPIAEGGLSQAWANWFMQVFTCLPWVKALSVKATLDFPSVAARSQQSLTATIKGARPGDAVQVTPASDPGTIVFTGVVTDKDVVTVYAKNFGIDPIDPDSQAFRIIVIQN
jgi:hypothetical protein